MKQQMMKKTKLTAKLSRISSPFDASVHKTERTANQKLVEWINQIVKEKTLPLGLAEQETSGADRKQPDIVIFESPRSDNVLCVIELKPPYFDAIDSLRKTILSHNGFYKNEELRIYPKKQSELWEEGFDTEENKYTGSKWGKYLRAPEIFFKILEKGKDKLVPLKEIASIRRGFTTGANEFFYLTEDEIARLGIEKEFWMHKDDKGEWRPNYIFRSPQDSATIKIPKEVSKQRILLIGKEKKVKPNIAKYIKEGERKGFSRRETCAARSPWYSLDEIKGNLFWMKDARLRLPVFYSQEEFFCDCRLYAITTSEPIVLGGILNSTIEILFAEFLGRQLGGGGGPRDIMAYEVKHLLTINPKTLTQPLKQSVGGVFEQIAVREVLPIFDEIGASSPNEVSLDKVKPDRRELDKIIMGEILGLTDDEQIEIYRAVVDLVKSRIEKAKSVDKKGKAKEGIDVELLTKTIKEKLGDKLLGHFYKEKILIQKDLKTVRLFHPAKEVRIEHGLFGWRLSSGKDHIDCESEEQARYLKIWIDAGMDEVKIPEDKKYLKAVLTELDALKEKIDQTIYEHVSSIVNQKLRGKIMQELQGELFK